VLPLPPPGLPLRILRRRGGGVRFVIRRHGWTEEGLEFGGGSRNGGRRMRRGRSPSRRLGLVAWGYRRH
jgi:hypothetical protein